MTEQEKAYKKKKQQIIAKMHSIEEYLRYQEQSQVKIATCTWADVATIGHVDELLSEIQEFLGCE